MHDRPREPRPPAVSDREHWPLATVVDVADARRAVHAVAREAGFRSVDAVRLATAASELGRNAVVHGKGGRMVLCRLDGGRGLRLEFYDDGPGISDIEQALVDGWSSVGSLGRGLGGARRLVDEFRLDSRVGQGTHVVVTRWRR